MVDYINVMPLTTINKYKKNLLSPINSNTKTGLNNYIQNNSFNNYYKSNDESFNQKYESLINLWKDLGVTIDFQDEFKKMFSFLTEEEKQIYIHNEKKNLKKVRNSIIKLIKEILSREKNIQILKKFNEMLEDEEENIDDSIIIDSINVLKKIRINSLKCVNRLIKVRELTLFQKQNGKYNIKNMDPAYKYNENYLMKMKYDLDFLKNSNLSEYIEFSNGDIDPFLICSSQKNNKKRNQDKIIIPINDDLLDEIKQAKYYIIQDLLFSNIPQDNNIELKNNLNSTSVNNENSNIDNYSKLKNQSRFLSPLNKGYSFISRKSNSLNKSSGDNSFLKNINMSRTLHKLKINKGPEKYDLMFLNPKQELYKIKHLQKSSRDDSSINKFDNSNINNTNITKLYNNKNDKQINSEIFEESDEYETETNVKKYNWKNDMMTRNEFLTKLNEYEYKDEEKNESSLSKIFKEKIIEEEEKKSEEKVKNKNIDESDELLYEYITTENENEQEIIDESKEEESNDYNSKLFESNIKQYNIEYFEKDINDLIEIIKKNNYIKSIPQTLKDLFNLNNKKSFTPTILMKGIYPKIIVSYNDNVITGICIYSFSSLEKPTKISINHLSSINYSSDLNDYVNEIEGLINFIKEKIDYDIMEIKINSNKDLDKTLKRAFKINLSFKIFEKKLIHTYYSFNDDYDDEIEKKSNQFLSIKSSSLISYSSKKNELSSNTSKYINLFQIYSILNEKKEIKEFELEEISDKGLIFESKKLKEYYKNNLTFALDNFNLDIAKNFIQKNVNDNFGFEDMNNHENQNDLMIFNFTPLIRSAISVEINEYLYNRIEDNIELLYKNDKDCKIYLIPTYNKNIKVIIGEINEEMKNTLINNSNNIYEVFYEFYNSLEKNNNKSKKVIYVPSFSIKSHLIATNIDNVEKNIKITNNLDNNNLYIISLDEYYLIEWNTDMNYKNTPYNTPKINKDIIIKDTFLFGIFDQKLYDSNKISAIQLYIINKENWNKKN